MILEWEWRLATGDVVRAQYDTDAETETVRVGARIVGRSAVGTSREGHAFALRGDASGAVRQARVTFEQRGAKCTLVVDDATIEPTRRPFEEPPERLADDPSAGLMLMSSDAARMSIGTRYYLAAACAFLVVAVKLVVIGDVQTALVVVGVGVFLAVLHAFGVGTGRALAITKTPMRLLMPSIVLGLVGGGAATFLIGRPKAGPWVYVVNNGPSKIELYLDGIDDLSVPSRQTELKELPPHTRLLPGERALDAKDPWGTVVDSVAITATSEPTVYLFAPQHDPSFCFAYQTDGRFEVLAAAERGKNLWILPRHVDTWFAESPGGKTGRVSLRQLPCSAPELRR